MWLGRAGVSIPRGSGLPGRSRETRSTAGGVRSIRVSWRRPHLGPRLHLPGADPPQQDTHAQFSSSLCRTPAPASKLRGRCEQVLTQPCGPPGGPSAPPPPFRCRVGGGEVAGAIHFPSGAGRTPMVSVGFSSPRVSLMGGQALPCMAGLRRAGFGGTGASLRGQAGPWHRGVCPSSPSLWRGCPSPRPHPAGPRSERREPNASFALSGEVSVHVRLLSPHSLYFNLKNSTRSLF